MSDYSKMVLIPEHVYNNIVKNKAHDNHFLNHANAKQMTNIVASDLDKINIKFDEGKDKGSILIKKDDKPKTKTTSSNSTSTSTTDNTTTESGTQTTAELQPVLRDQNIQTEPTTRSQGTDYKVPDEIMTNTGTQTLPTSTSQGTDYVVPHEIMSNRETQTLPSTTSQGTNYETPIEVMTNTGIQTLPTTTSQGTDYAAPTEIVSNREIQTLPTVQTQSTAAETDENVQSLPMQNVEMQIDPRIQLDPILEPPPPPFIPLNPNPNPDPVPPQLAISEIESPIITDVTDIPELMYQVDRDDDVRMREYPITNYPLNENRQELVRNFDEPTPQFANFSNYPPDFYYLNRENGDFRTVLSPVNFPQIRNAAFNMFNNANLRRPVVNLSPELHNHLQQEHLIPSLTYRHRGSIPALKYHPRDEENRVDSNRKTMREKLFDKRKEKREKMSRRNIDETDDTAALEMNEPLQAIEYKPTPTTKGKGKNNVKSRIPRRIAVSLDSDGKDDKLKEKMRKNVTQSRKKVKDLSQINKVNKALETEDAEKRKPKSKYNLRKRQHFDYDTDPESTSVLQTYETRKLRVPKKKSR